MDSPELIGRFESLASTDNRLIIFYYKHIIVPIVLKYAKKSDSFIDLGCGGGVLLTLLKKRGFVNLYGIDAAETLLDRISDKDIPTVADTYLNIKMHFKENYFDAATVFNTLHHLDTEEELDLFFKNLHYVLKPGSIVIVKELHKGLLRRIYYFLIFNKFINKLFPSFFKERNLVETEEKDMHARFYKSFGPSLNEVIEKDGRFKIIKEYHPLTFEKMIVLETKK